MKTNLQQAGLALALALPAAPVAALAQPLPASPLVAGSSFATAPQPSYAGQPVGRVLMMGAGPDGTLAPMPIGPVGANSSPGAASGGLPGSTVGTATTGAGLAAAAFDALTGSGLPTTGQMASVVSNTGSTSSNTGSMSSALGTVAANTAPRQAAWVDASLTATGTATALAAQPGRVGLHLTNTGGSLACFNYTSPATLNAGSTGCGLGSQPLGANGGQYFEDLPGNVSPEAISLICAGASCPITIKAR